MIGTEANLQRLNQVVAEIDIPVSKQLSGIDVYNVQHTNAGDLAKVLHSGIDRAAKKGIIKKGAANRYKSRIAKAAKASV